MRATNGNPNDVWAVGGYGTVLHWNGAAWSPVTFPSGETLSSVWAAAPDDVWVSSLGRTIYRWNGAAWSSTRPGAPDWLNSLWAAGPNDAWVVGKSSGVARFGANTWTFLDPGTSTDFEAIHGTAFDNVWMVGTRSVVRRFDGSALQPIAVPDAGTIDFKGVWATGPGSAVALGGDVAVHFDPGGSRVFRLPLTTGAEAAVSGPAPDNLWALASGVLLHFDGGVWANAGFTGPQALRALDVHASGGWAVGDRGALVRYDGQRWSTFSEPRQASSVSGLYAVSESEVFAASSVPLRFDGVAWRPLQSSGVAFGPNAVHGTSGSDVWFTTGLGTVYHWDGTALVTVPTPITEQLTAVYARAVDDVWVVGLNGTVAHYDGTAWALVPVPRPAHFRAVWAGSASEVWVVGDNIALKRTPTGWDDFGADAGSVQYSAVWGSGPNDVVFTTLGGLKRWDGATLGELSAPGPVGLPFVNVWGLGPEDYYVSSFSRGIYRHHLDGGWEPLPVPTFFHASALSGAGNRVWAGNALGIFGHTR